MLKAGSTRVHIRRGQEVREFVTGPGFFKVEQDRALALVDDAVDVDDIDRERAQAQLEAAQAELGALDAGESDADRWQLEQRIRHAENQLAVASGSGEGTSGRSPGREHVVGRLVGRRTRLGDRRETGRPLRRRGLLVAVALAAGGALAGSGDPQKKQTKADQARANGRPRSDSPTSGRAGRRRRRARTATDPSARPTTRTSPTSSRPGSTTRRTSGRADGSFVSSTTGIFKTVAMAKTGYARVGGRSCRSASASSS